MIRRGAYRVAAPTELQKIRRRFVKPDYREEMLLLMLEQEFDLNDDFFKTIPGFKEAVIDPFKQTVTFRFEDENGRKWITYNLE